MIRSKAGIIGLALAFSVAGTALPSRAHADNVGLWVGVGIGAYIILLATATLIAFPNPAPLAPDLVGLPEKEPADDTLRFARGCRQEGTSLVLACW